MLTRAALFLLIPLSLFAAQDGYLGRDVCAGCHKEIAATQARTAMAQTWRGTGTGDFPAAFSERVSEEPEPAIRYLIQRATSGLEFGVEMPGTPAVKLPVEIVMGGKRHGSSFLARISAIEGTALARAQLIETRYLHYAPENRLERSPGFPAEKPATYETAFGRVLAPGFEKKCLTCHGQPRMWGTHRETGVTCESCHGPGRAHLTALAKKTADKGILNPAKLPPQEQMRPCSECHSGFSNVQDPLPDDLLISDQVTALSNSECWRQTGGRVSCTNCHNPHEDAPRAALVSRAEKTCLGCHSGSVTNHAGLCPVNRSSGCVGCHMPDSKKAAPFVISDHWIRVHPEQHVPVGEHSDAWRSTVQPKHLYLRMMVLRDREKARSVRAQIAVGGSFFDLARTNSIDQNTARNGGFLGDVDTSQMDTAWAARVLALRPGELSGVIEARDKFLIIERMPRDFREEAAIRFNRAMELRGTSKQQDTANELLEALKVYPGFLRALTYLGISYGEAGNPQAAAGVLGVAAQLYPGDAGAHFNLGIAYGASGKDQEIDEYKRTIEIDPDYVLAYLNLGAALDAKGRLDEAVAAYREGINVNPLVASLHYSLSVALEKQGKTQEAQTESVLALKIDPNVAKR